MGDGRLRLACGNCCWQLLDMRLGSDKLTSEAGRGGRFASKSRSLQLTAGLVRPLVTKGRPDLECSVDAVALRRLRGLVVSRGLCRDVPLAATSQCRRRARSVAGDFGNRQIRCSDNRGACGALESAYRSEPGSSLGICRGIGPSRTARCGGSSVAAPLRSGEPGSPRSALRPERGGNRAHRASRTSRAPRFTRCGYAT